MVSCAPLFHLADAWATFAITWAGGKHVLVPSFDALQVLKLIQEERITLSNLIPYNAQHDGEPS